MKYVLLRRVIIVDSDWDGIAKGETTLMVENYDLEKVVDTVLPMVMEDEMYGNYTEEELRSEIYKDIATSGDWRSLGLYSRKPIAGMRLKVKFLIKMEK